MVAPRDGEPPEHMVAFYVNPHPRLVLHRDFERAWKERREGERNTMIGCLLDVRIEPPTQVVLLTRNRT